MDAQVLSSRCNVTFTHRRPISLSLLSPSIISCRPFPFYSLKSLPCIFFSLLSLPFFFTFPPRHGFLYHFLSRGSFPFPPPSSIPSFLLPFLHRKYLQKREEEELRQTKYLTTFFSFSLFVALF